MDMIYMDERLIDEKYMRRALSLARNGMGYASPNPMVGAVIVSPDSRIIGEGWHRRCGEGHAEVNAVASVRDCDRHLLAESTIYVTLEPCAHYGKTPPCAELIIRTHMPRVVVGCVDPFAKVAGRGIAMLREAGIEVTVGVLEDECKALNRRFFTAHTMGRPFITLKWARSADGFMDCVRTSSHPSAFRFSNDLTSMATMKLRSLHDAVLTTAATVRADDCRLTVRGWDGCQPMRIVLDRHGEMPQGSRLLSGGSHGVSVLSGKDAEVEAAVRHLYENYGVTSVLVEAGPRLQRHMIECGLWDAAREEIAPVHLGDRGTHKAPELPVAMVTDRSEWNGNTIVWYSAR